MNDFEDFIFTIGWLCIFIGITAGYIGMSKGYDSPWYMPVAAGVMFVILAIVSGSILIKRGGRYG